MKMKTMTQRKTVTVEDQRAERLLYDALRKKARGRTELVRLTRADAVATTGMPAEQAEPALKSLVKSYKSHVAVTDEGELVYAFDPSLERRDALPLSERLRALGLVAWRGFQVFFKIWIAVTLVVYVAAFVAMMIGLMLARSASDRDDRGHDGGGMFWLWFWLMPDLAPPEYQRRARRRTRPRKRFYLSVFDFVFGPKQAPVDPREADKRLIAFLRDHKGRVAAAELVALTGLSYDAADEELTRLLVEYDGEVEVTEDGTLVYVFEGLLPSTKGAGEPSGTWAWAWDRADPQRSLTGNTPGANAVVGGFAGFNLLASLTIGPAFLERVQLAGDPLATFFVTLFPLMFSAVFFAVPAARLVVERRRARARQTRLVRSEVLREIWNRDGGRLDPDALARDVAARTQRPITEARAAIETLLAELDGDVETDDEGRMRYVFKRLSAERQQIARAREQAPKLPQLGMVEFSSED